MVAQLIEKYWKSSIRTKIGALLLSGIVLSVVYVLGSYTISDHNQLLLEGLKEKKLPLLSTLSELKKSIADSKRILSEASVSQSFDVLTAIETADRNVKRIIADVEKMDIGDINYMAHIKADYEKAHNKANTILQNVVSGIEKMKDNKTGFQESLEALGEVELKVEIVLHQASESLSNDVLQINNGNQQVLKLALFLLFGYLLFSVFFYLVVEKIHRALSSTNNTLDNSAKEILDICEKAQISSLNLNNSAETQSTTAKKTTASMDKMKLLLDQTATTTKVTLAQADGSLREAAEGQEVVEDLKVSMKEIERSYQDLEKINEMFALIQEKTKIINEIVLKTQILSFNANIEAARAGALGRGFAVVANEVANLSNLSGSAAEEIESLLKSSSQQVADTVQLVKEKILQAQVKSKSCGEVFKAIVGRSKEVREQISQVDQASTEQTRGVHEVIEVMNELSYVSQSTHTLSSDIRRFSEGLRKESERLAGTIDELTSLVGSGDSKPRGDGKITFIKSKSDRPHDDREDTQSKIG